ncbi:hypothetical protein KUTeg_008823 [Tegillarca granosa]|uniref:Integrin alpha third immunoglobulin-like domain-containing protein n=1 Tax=Tegillarca granosa TaxID=220873 RepID=A0ABQ9FEJ7_TEGGR|nr:hypothetical protein KUTeg_008823 [Tegillarca granosa]
MNEEVQDVIKNRMNILELLIGAPVADPLLSGEKPGALYRCIATNPSSSDCLPQPQIEANNDNIGSRINQWLGVTVKSMGKDKKVMVCAHRHTVNYDGRGFSTAAEEVQDVIKNQMNILELLIGAPVDDPLLSGEKPGALYRCIATNPSSSDCLPQPQIEANNDNIGSRINQWLGVTVKSMGKDKKVMVCAHRHTVNYDGRGFSTAAVGAPYEGMKGAIYIFHGTATGLKDPYVQRIYAEEIDMNLKTFGYAIAGEYTAKPAESFREKLENLVEYHQFGFSPGCEAINETTIRCDGIGNPFGNEAKTKNIRKFSILLNTDKLPNSPDIFEIKTLVNTTSTDLSPPSSRQTTMRYRVVTRANIVVTGTAQPGSDVYELVSGPAGSGCRHNPDILNVINAKENPDYVIRTSNDCKKGTAKCHRIICDIGKLNEQKDATIIVRARLWKSTLLEDFPNAGELGFFNRMKRPGYEPTYQGEIKKSPKDYNNDYYS